MKLCKTCKQVKEDFDFYKIKHSSDGLNSECKNCTKERSKRNAEAAKLDPEKLAKMRKNARESYYRNGNSYKPSTESERVRNQKRWAQFPEKKKARNASQYIKTTIDGHVRHHWSYNEPHWKDIIELSAVDHSFLHRHIIYDQERMMYRRSTDSVLLDTKESHIQWWLFINDNFER
jgi:hypothetical protein